MKNKLEQTLSSIRNKAYELGFDGCGFTDAVVSSTFASWFENYLAEGLNGDLHYLARNKAKILNPSVLMPDAKTVVCLTAHYRCNNKNDNPKIARYAQVNDYHLIAKEKAHELLTYMQDLIPGLQGRVFIDSGCFPEKYFAAQAGLGFIGKNNLLIQPSAGSFLFISTILINHALPSDTPLTESCGSCTRCVDACPVGALGHEGLDARRCLSFHNIENQRTVPGEIAVHLKDHWFGCDICQEVCPWNAEVNWPQPRLFHLMQPVTGLSYQKLGEYTEAEFARDFSNTVLRRAGLEKLKHSAGYKTD